jgi:hypothetical protein
MIKIEYPEGGECKDGIAVIRKIIEKRIDLALFDNSVLDILIKKTGGSLRDLFACIRGAAKIANRKNAQVITNEDADIMLNELRSSLTRLIEDSNYDFLIEIINGNRESIKNRQMLLEMMQANTVLEYNAKQWHNVHPMVKEFLINIGKVK